MENDTSLEYLRHSLAHLLAASVLELYPEAKNTIGPAIENGFYYDFEFPTPLSENDLPKIEEKMKAILKTWKQFSHKEVSADEARAHFAGNPYKLELIEEITAKGETITLYTCGTFTDLCRGGHVEDASKIQSNAFKLEKLAGAYWRGSEKNKQLTRIYGLAFKSKDELQKHINMMEEAKKRDHRKLGQELELFMFDDLIGKGLPLWLPNGTIIKNEIEKLATEMESKYDYVRVSTPLLAKEELYLTSGHLPYYADSMYPAMKMDDGTYYLRAMNCPHHHIIYRSRPRSYRELPLRLAEYGTVYRNELSGTLAGLLRVRSLQMNDAHIYCTKDQIKTEFKRVLDLTMEYFKIFGLHDFWFRLSKWDPAHTEKYINEPQNWDFAESVLREILVESGVPFKEVSDEAAFYGPKVDVQFKSIIGREETMSTIQLDFLARERFKLNYKDATGGDNNEVFVIHRAPLSTHERFMAFLIEHYGGVFPTWLSPLQVSVIPVSDKHLEYAEAVQKALKEAGIRSEVNSSNDTLGKKIREGKTRKVPYLLVLGDKEIEAQGVTAESHKAGSMGALSLDAFLTHIKAEIASRA